MSLRCPNCGEYVVPFGGEVVCAETDCPGPNWHPDDDRDELDDDGYEQDYPAWEADAAVSTR